MIASKFAPLHLSPSVYTVVYQLNVLISGYEDVGSIFYGVKANYPSKLGRNETTWQILPSLQEVRVPSHVATTRILLGTLSSSSNPITHSDIRKRTGKYIVVSTATGHQVAEGSANRLLYLQERDRKLEAQRECTTCDQNRALYLVRAYIDGYLEGTTDIEIKRLICTGGGRVMSTASNCTHIVTSRTLAASKVEGLLCGHKLNKVYIVRPEWVIDSITIGKRQSEHNYSIKLNIM